jgi:hypothetical protein
MKLEGMAARFRWPGEESNRNEPPRGELSIYQRDRTLCSEGVMFHLELCAIALLFLLAGCVEATDPVHRHGILVKTCPNLRTFYTFQNKLYLKEGNRYRHVDSNDIDVCGQIAML